MGKSARGRRSATKSSDGYCPDAGEIVWVDFSPHKGREQAGRRPAVVLSPRGYNRLTQLCVVCPITSRVKNYPFEVPLPETGTIKGGVVLADQVKSISWQERRSEFAGTSTPGLMAEIKARIEALLQFS